MENEKGVRLNKYLADAGKCSRREADRWIEEGRVWIDGRRGTLGDRVLPGMKVTIAGASTPSAVWTRTARGFCC